jgi:hypothetical protein
MKILGALLINDKRLETVLQVMDTCLKVKYLEHIEIFCFSTEKKTIQLMNKYRYKINVSERPLPDMSKITCSYVNLPTGMDEIELMQLAFLRNQAIERADSGNFDYIYFIDSDILLKEDSLQKLLGVDADIALGWYFHKRLGYETFTTVSLDNIVNKMQEGAIVDAKSGVNGGVLYNRKIIENVRYDKYHGTKAEDSVFYEKTLKAGYKIKLHLGVFYRHIGSDWKPQAIKYADHKSKLCKIKSYK